MKRIYLSDDKRILAIYEDSGRITILNLKREVDEDNGEGESVGGIGKGELHVDEASDRPEVMYDEPVSGDPPLRGIAKKVAAYRGVNEGRAEQRCGLCGEPGHRRPTCGRRAKVESDDERPVGSFRHDSESKAEDISGPMEEIPGQSFVEQVQELKSQGMTSREVARELGVSIGKVNDAWVYRPIEKLE